MAKVQENLNLARIKKNGAAQQKRSDIAGRKPEWVKILNATKIS